MESSTLILLMLGVNTIFLILAIVETAVILYLLKERKGETEEELEKMLK